MEGSFLSYAVLATIVSLIYGFAGMLFIVYANAGTKHPFRIVWASIAYWSGLIMLAHLTTGWESAVSSVLGAVIMFLIDAEPLGLILYTYGQVLLKIVDHDRVYNLPIAEPLDAVGRALERCRPALRDRSVVGWSVVKALNAYDTWKRRRA